MDLVKIAKWIVNPDSSGCTDIEFAELMALVSKYKKDGNKTDPELTVTDMVTMDIDAICNWFRDCLEEIIYSKDIDASAWWKIRDSDEFVLTEQGKKVVHAFIAECKAKRKEILDAGLDEEGDTVIPTTKDIEADIAFIGVDDDGDYYNSWGITDNTEYDLPIHLTYGIDFVPKRLTPILTDDEIAITVYRETISPDLAGDDHPGTLIVKKDMLMKYFREHILSDFRSDDKTVSDEGLLQEWLDEYTADSTTDLYDFIQSEEKKAKDREYYQKLYDKKYDKLLEEARNKGCPDPESEANEAFNECATAEEVVGYYITWHGDDAFKDWFENSQLYRRERCEIPSEQDRAITRILGELYDNTVVKGIEWYVPEGTSVSPKLPEVKVIPKITGRTEKECTEAVRLYLQLIYATEPKAFSFMLPDGRMAGYRNWELSSTTKKGDDVGCYGAGSEPCLNGCAGCDRLKRELKFETRNAMEEYLKCGDAYNPITETFVSQYNDKGHIVVYTGIDVMRARQLAEETRRAGEESWISVIGPGGAIYEKDFPFDSAADSWMRDNFSKDGWVVADTDTFSNENKIFIHHAWDFDPVDWIVGISGSDMDDVIVKVITGTTNTVKRHLLTEAQNIRADRKNDHWGSGAETVDDINVHGDGKLYACACFRDCHFDLTATPMSNVQHIMPFN
ncbi:hypothetical protein [Butyrivibrio sp.]|uniref:hypothetical protein n=1 Tax=Butyrivibrio sp. TaxID=28121 RepID=UPI0025B95787|nr:hypothetical protein [Butyrivibrio sp.]MBQ7428400.1 hypothetical protein [Butyrivibrio sp.]MBQ9303331.1 hypothetical protein [Butyrivibrio sp.]